LITVVLGRSDGEELRKRVEKGSQVFKQENCDYLVLSGGKVDPEASKSEASTMKEYVEDVPNEKIILENRSKGTIGNAFFTRRILESREIDVDKIFVVTSCYHRKRGEYIFEQVFGKTLVDVSHCVEYKNSKEEDKEEESFNLAKNFFKDISPGDMNTIKKQLTAYFDNVEFE
jgi:uncharacterized SAM-binding protein YcdF (DUF218 family)